MGSKHIQPVWLTVEEAEAHCQAGASVWKFCSTDNGVDPDVVLVGIGADLMFEVIAAAAYFRHLTPALKIRVVNVTDLMVCAKFQHLPPLTSHLMWQESVCSQQKIQVKHTASTFF